MIIGLLKLHKTPKLVTLETSKKDILLTTNSSIHN